MNKIKLFSVIILMILFPHTIYGKNIVIFSATSDIGAAISEELLKQKTLYI